MSRSSFPKERWYKNAVFYAIIVETFKDGNADGIGDFVGLTLKLDYIKQLGVDCIWLLPFYPTGGRDNGYDVTDYYNVDPRFGTLGEFKTFVSEAQKRGIKVIIDLVVHHTSDLHPWFVESNQDEDSPYKEYYIWTRQIPKNPQPQSAFPGIEAGVWRYSGDAREFYYHSFYHFEPDLNIVNPKVQEEIIKIMDFWMDLGIDGFRVDAATLMFDRKGIIGTEVLDPSSIMKSWSKHIKDRNPEGILLAEADVTIDKISMFFGEGQQMDLLFNFLLNRYLFLSLAEKKSTPINDFIVTLPKPPVSAQWVNFLRNLDELNIQQLEKPDEEKVFKVFAPNEGMRIYNRGIRRRLAPMLDGDLKRLKMAYALLFSLPGAQMISYGDEIGMGEDLQLPEREAVRTPMQWADKPNADFSDSHPSTLVKPIIDTGPFSFKQVNVEAQIADKDSLYNHIKILIGLINKYKITGHGDYNILEVSSKQVFAIEYNLEDEMVLTLVNVSEKEETIDISEKGYEIEAELYNDGNYNGKPNPKKLLISPYGYRWLTVNKK